MAQLQNPMNLVDWLDDICVRFIVNLPREELESVQRIMFQIEEGHWYYEDFIRPLDPTLPSINLKQFCALIFHHCPLLVGFSHFHAVAYAEFSAYKTRVPVRGAIMLNDDMTKAVLVKGWKKGAKWSFPRGKINKDENDFDCAVREVLEETGYDLRAAGVATDEASSHHLEVTLREQQMRLYVFRGVPMETHFEPLTRKEISKIEWYNISDLPGGKSKKHIEPEDTLRHNQFYMVTPFIGGLKSWIKQQRKKERLLAGIVPIDTAKVDDSGVGTDLEALAPELAHNDAAESRHFNSLLARLNKPTFVAATPTSRAEPTSQTDDLALQLKRLLSVGGAEEPPAAATRPNFQTSHTDHGTQGVSLLSLLQPSGPSIPQMASESTNVSPEYARISQQHYAPSNQLEQFASPPPYSITQGIPYGPALPFNQHGHPPFHSRPHAQYEEWHQSSASQPPYYNMPSQPSIPLPPSIAQQSVSYPFGNADQAFPPVAAASSNSDATATRAAQPDLSAQSLLLLNAFKSQPDPARHVDPAIAPPYMPNHLGPLHHVQASAQGQSASYQPHTNGRHNVTDSAPMMPVNQKPSQANTLLSLFQSSTATKQVPLVGTADRPAELAHPIAELAAASPSQVRSKKTRPPTTVKTNMTTPMRTASAELTSATVSGPLNAPNFARIARQAPAHELGTLPESCSNPVPVHTVSPGMMLEAPRAMHHPSILDRQTTPANVLLQASQSKRGTDGPAPAVFDKRGTQSLDQKTVLMSLFGKQTIDAVKASTSQQPQPQPPSMSSMAMARQRMPSHNSPISPLPTRTVPMQAHPKPLSKSSRVSSIADESLAAVGPIKSPITPVEQQNFLLQYLQNVVTNEGRG